MFDRISAWAFLLVLGSSISSIASEQSVKPPIASEQSVKPAPNELGTVMILMYHDFGPREATWMRTPENFKKDLETLYNKGYRPISLTDFVRNHITTPAGYTPVVITFDDGKAQQFEVTVQDDLPQVSPQSAVGIFMGFVQTHEDFPLEATFFLNGKYPFKQPEWVAFKLNFLVDHGMDIGNHTTGHHNLALKENQRSDIIQKAIGKQAQRLESFISNEDYRVNTLALCFGQRPRKSALHPLLKNGVFKGRPYENIAVLNVGAGPAPSPVDKKFDPLRLPRIRASELNTGRFGLYDWLEYFENHPRERFVSDGNPDTVTIQKSDSDRVSEARNNGKSIVFLDE